MDGNKSDTEEENQDDKQINHSLDGHESVILEENGNDKQEANDDTQLEE